MKYLLLLSCAVLLSGCTYSSNSMKTGQVVSIANEGVWHTTTEVEIIKGSINNGSGAFSKPFWFTVSDPTLIAKCNQAFAQEKDIIVEYHATTWCPFASGNPDCNFADNITIQ